MEPTFYITTLGCPKNQADSREMERSLLRRGLSPAATPEAADFHLINSCSFIESARVETIQVALEAAELKDAKPGQKLILAGCFAERYATAVRDELPEVDFSFGTGLYHRAGELVADRPYAPIKISDGCNRGCAFCAIPQFRGPFRDIARDSILEEARLLAAEGVRELCLVSQDTNNYGAGPDALVDLLGGLEEISGLEWLRLLYLYPDPRTEQLLQKVAASGLKKITPYLETPVQHVSARVLKNMRRYGSYERFLDLFQMARSLFPGLEVRTSFLVGFPGEEDEDVDLLARFIQEARPEKLALFSYSLEEETPGFALGDATPDHIKAERINRVRNAHIELLKELHRERVGRVYQCIVDEITPEHVLARRAQDAPEIDEAVFLPRTTECQTGDILTVEISGFYEYDMSGRALAGSRA
jgi:ribosomal protein S12 methylthiotransferase